MASCSEYFGVCCVKFKETNQIFSSLKISQSINTESSTCDRNNKRMYSWFYESKKLLGCLMKRKEKKKQKMVKMSFLKILLKTFLLA